jgi:murein DD-endopeptidase MepM/ murein hydrolase activator NlpD
MPPSPTPTPQDPACDESLSPLYCVYTVQSGDTLSKIAALFGLKSSEGVANWELLVQSNRPDIASADDVIQAGQKLRVPMQNGIVHPVLTGETLAELAADYGVTVAAIEEAGNDLSGDGVLSIGQELLIPNPTRLPPIGAGSAAPQVTTSPTPEPTAAPAVTATTAAAQASPTPGAAESATVEATPEKSAPSVTPGAGSNPAATATPRSGRATRTPTATRTPRAAAAAAQTTAAPAAAAASANGFIWPANGPLSSYFGGSHPLGIDIDLFQNPEAPVVASAAGSVVFAGGDVCCSYGLYIIIDHGNGYTTLYAHLSNLAVSQGQKVSQGQFLGYGGRTGYATGNHLHFEVRLNGDVIDPLGVLP